MKVLMAIDDSPYSQDVVARVSRRRWPADTEFRVLTVLEPISLHLQRQKWSSVLTEVTSRREDSARKLCSHARDTLMAHIPSARVHYEIRDGKPWSEIVDSAGAWGADKIIVGAHGRGVCPRFVLGSVSSAVATHAPCSVEIVRARSAHRKLRVETETATGKH